jgi:hypothetical protein
MWMHEDTTVPGEEDAMENAVMNASWVPDIGARSLWR